ncbi:uncharacterized protein N7498_004155 [Penicillium cinerascens]|uniref:Uncharacterized protein n=1 Tax=Penicillium cinerascens TaxID=70096 RepID=A0A9W9T7T6_9EURO|nr:uncharacterized protein N7498_004155 [Penicillium cinerascens]KAJ5212509.1 hypothetical protein N7498_004155 [Penicillium cinerascens]
MSLLSIRSTWSIIAMLAMLPLSSVYARPTRESGTVSQVQPATNIQPRDPRLIPAAERYLADAFAVLGVSEPETSQTPIPLTSVHISLWQDTPENITATPTASATKTTQPAMYTTNIRHGDDKPIENIQVGSGWTGGNKLQASDLPFIFDALSKALDHRFRNMIDSSDERGLGDDSGSNDLRSEIGFLR